jgi:SP family general alpha glucoside:H+ symporter-like MFS transporter
LETNLTIWAWRIPFADQWVWPVIIIPLIYFAPESPWWLVRKGSLQEAEHSAKRLASFQNEQQVRDMVALMVETTALERKITEGATYLDCFHGSDLWRTEISCCIYIAEVLVGFALTSYASYFFEQAGLSSANSYKLTLGQGGLDVVCTVLSCFLIGNFGRRTIYIGGCAAMATTMFTIGFLSLPKETPVIFAASAGMYMLYFCLYLLTLGPISYTLVGEVSSSRLRSHIVALGRNAYNLVNLLSSGTAPVILNPTADNWKGKSGFLAGVLGLLAMT